MVTVGSFTKLPSGKLSHNYGKPPFLWVNQQMTVFNSKLFVYQRVNIHKSPYISHIFPISYHIFHIFPVSKPPMMCQPLYLYKPINPPKYLDLLDSDHRWALFKVASHDHFSTPRGRTFCETLVESNVYRNPVGYPLVNAYIAIEHGHL